MLRWGKKELDIAETLGKLRQKDEMQKIDSLSPSPLGWRGIKRPPPPTTDSGTSLHHQHPRFQDGSGFQPAAQRLWAAKAAKS